MGRSQAEARVVPVISGLLLTAQPVDLYEFIVLNAELAWRAVCGQAAAFA